MPFEDIALMQAIPRLTVVEPSDYYSCAALVKAAAEHYGCVYIRFPRKPVPVIYSETETFKFGQSKLIKGGKDLCFVCLGSLLLNEALKASAALAAEGIDAGVLDVLSVKPLDTETILGLAGKVTALITAENAQLAGGLGSTIAALLAENGLRCKFARIGIQNEFGEVGTQDYLVKRFGLTADNLIAKAREILK
jgi:transketolase